MANLIKKGKEVICVTGNPIQQPRRKSLSRQVMESIEKLILEQDLKPGDVLPTETQISETLQVSKSSVREAVKMLEALGVVEIRRGLCTVISANPEQGYLNVMLSHLYLNSGNEEELQVFRRTVESAYTTLAIDAATELDLAAIQASLAAFREKMRSGQLMADDDLAFHSQILQATHNSFMISLGGALNELFRETIGISIRCNPEIALEDHEKICAAILARDKDAAIAAIWKSARQWAAAFRLREQDTDSAT